ncbi:MAG: hypothetical protein AAGA57_12710, partial [Planctomycetota bacterium]
MIHVHATPRSVQPRMRYYWDDPLPPLESTDITKAIGLWSAVVLVCGAPSFVLGLFTAGNTVSILAMLSGLAIVIGLYVVWTVSPRGRRIRRMPFVMSTAYIGYGTRIALSLIALTGVGAIPDMVVGIFVGAMLDTLTGASIDTLPDVSPAEVAKHFAIILVWTLLTAAVWNVIILVYMAIVYGLQRLFRKMPTGRPGEVCAACGYDIHMSTGQCPECGEPIPDR